VILRYINCFSFVEVLLLLFFLVLRQETSVDLELLLSPIDRSLMFVNIILLKIDLFMSSPRPFCYRVTSDLFAPGNRHFTLDQRWAMLYIKRVLK
jgi:hypothetical protein